MVVVEVLDRKSARYRQQIRRQAEWLLKTVPGNFYMEVYLVGGDFMRKNVLSFTHPADFPRPDIAGKPLGEIYLNPQYIKEHDEDLAFMLIHGFLHLLGYDHIKKSDRMVMQRREALLLAQIAKR